MFGDLFKGTLDFVGDVAGVFDALAGANEPKNSERVAKAGSAREGIEDLFAPETSTVELMDFSESGDPIVQRSASTPTKSLESEDFRAATIEWHRRMQAWGKGDI